MKTLCAAFATLAVASLLAASAAAKIERNRVVDPNDTMIQHDDRVVLVGAVIGLVVIGVLTAQGWLDVLW
jgi:hypothetical protein